MSTPFLRISSIIAAHAVALALLAQPGSLDPTFAAAGKYVQNFGANDNLTCVKVQPDGKVLAAGTAINANFSGKLLVVRLNPDGTPDNGFDGDGTLIVNAFNESYAYDLFVQADGKIVVVGTRYDGSFSASMLALRLNADGTLDPSFGTGGYSEPNVSTGDDFAYAVAPLVNGQFLLAGSRIDSNFNNQPVVVRLNADGSVDNTFGNNGIAEVTVNQIENQFWSVGVQADGRIVASGSFSRDIGGGLSDRDVLVACFDANGVLDPTFGTNGTVVKAITPDEQDVAFGQALDASGNIFLAGFTEQADFSYDGFLLEMDADGADVTTFGTGGTVTFNPPADQNVFYDVILQPDGKPLVCGTSGGFIFNPRDQVLARYTTTGVLDNTFGANGYVLNSINGGFDEANALALQSDGAILVAGRGYSGTNNDITVFRHINDINTSVAEAVEPNALMVHPNPARSGMPIAMRSVEEMGRVRLFDASGAEVLLDVRSMTGPVRTVDLPADLAPGMYLLQAVGASGRTAGARLVVQD
ncbi:MAG: hypothetical protein JNL52_03410 [Flavobacteriales bacterium]|nr:hypothetical protein [Flavobacteriales bacterium]